MATNTETKSRTASGLARLSIIAIKLAAGVIFITFFVYGSYIGLLYLDKFLPRTTFDETVTVIERPIDVYFADKGWVGLNCTVRRANGIVDEIYLFGADRIPTGTKLQIVGEESMIFGSVNVSNYTVVASQ